MNAQTQAAADFAASDAAWWELLVMLCGNEADARDLRYSNLARGDAGTDLQTAYDCRTAAHDAWLAACNKGRAVEVAA